MSLASYDLLNIPRFEAWSVDYGVQIVQVWDFGVHIYYIHAYACVPILGNIICSHVRKHGNTCSHLKTHLETCEPHFKAYVITIVPMGQMPHSGTYSETHFQWEHIFSCLGNNVILIKMNVI